MQMFDRQYCSKIKIAYFITKKSSYLAFRLCTVNFVIIFLFGSSYCLILYVCFQLHRILSSKRYIYTLQLPRTRWPKMRVWSKRNYIITTHGFVFTAQCIYYLLPTVHYTHLKEGTLSLVHGLGDNYLHEFNSHKENRIRGRDCGRKDLKKLLRLLNLVFSPLVLYGEYEIKSVQL